MRRQQRLWFSRKCSEGPHDERQDRYCEGGIAMLEASGHLTKGMLQLLHLLTA